MLPLISLFYRPSCYDPFYPYPKMFKVISAAECERQYSTEELLQIGISRRLIGLVKHKLPKGFTREISCITNPIKTENPCEGDSGSPLFRFGIFCNIIFELNLETIQSVSRI